MDSESPSWPVSTRLDKRVEDARVHGCRRPRLKDRTRTIQSRIGRGRNRTGIVIGDRSR